MCFVPRVIDQEPCALLDRRLWSTLELRPSGVLNTQKPFLPKVPLPEVTDQAPHVDESALASHQGKLPN